MRYLPTQIADITSAQIHGAVNGDTILDEISTDSRTAPLQPASTLFVAIEGPSRDGHNFAWKSYRQGVRHFLVNRVIEGLPDDAVQIVVEDTLEALQTLAADNRARYNGPLVAITGSNGKTTLKEWIAQLWPDGAGQLLRSPRSYNSQLGVALSLLMIRGDERLVVIEAGISAPGEMQRLEAMIRPTIGVLTNIGDAHSENFRDNAHKESEKRKLFARTEMVIEGMPLRDILRAVYRAAGVESRDESELQPLAMRLEQLEGVDGMTILNDSYSNDPVSLSLALDALGRCGGSARVVVLSDVPQSAEPAEQLYGRVAQMISRHDVALFVGVGEELARFRGLFADNSLFYTTTEDLLRDQGQLKRAIPTTSALLIKGGRSYGFERVSRIFERRCHTTVMEVNLSYMAENLRYYRSLLQPHVRMMVMVKAYSYGHGAVEVAHMLEHAGVDYLGVAFADEGVTLRDGGVTMPIVVLNSDPGSFSVMADYGLEPEIYSISSLREYIAMADARGMVGSPIHLKLDTGMHRLGMMNEDIDPLVEVLCRQNTVTVRSVFSHLAASEDAAEDAFTERQIDSFESMSRRIVDALPYGAQIIRHIDNSAGIERHSGSHYDMVRLGIGLYCPENRALMPVATLRTRIVQIKSLTPGETVGYNRRGVVGSPMRMAIIPIGYADGLDRRLGCGNWSVMVDGVLCPIVGNVCMDTTIIDISAAQSASEGSEVVIFGRNPSVANMARVLNTITYEVLTGISHRIRRVYVSE